MADLNSVVLMGRLAADPELRQTQNGIAVATFRIAVNKMTKPNEHPEASWIDCVAWRGTGEFISKYFQKGSRIIVSGSLNTRTYKDKDDKNRKVIEVIVSNAYFVDKKQEATSAAPSNNTYESEPELSTSDEDLPFN